MKVEETERKSKIANEKEKGDRQDNNLDSFPLQAKPVIRRFVIGIPSFVYFFDWFIVGLSWLVQIPDAFDDEDYERDQEAKDKPIIDHLEISRFGNSLRDALQSRT